MAQIKINSGFFLKRSCRFFLDRFLESDITVSLARAPQFCMCFVNASVAHCEEHSRQFFHVFACFYLLEYDEVDFNPLCGYGGWF
jgi:hypothetical protein